jgi:hypothetical protein
MPFLMSGAALFIGKFCRAGFPNPAGRVWRFAATSIAAGIGVPALQGSVPSRPGSRRPLPLPTLLFDDSSRRACLADLAIR